MNVESYNSTATAVSPPAIASHIQPTGAHPVPAIPCELVLLGAALLLVILWELVLLGIALPVVVTHQGVSVAVGKGPEDSVDAVGTPASTCIGKKFRSGDAQSSRVCVVVAGFESGEAEEAAPEE
jgi:hypothetical protein